MRTTAAEAEAEEADEAEAEAAEAYDEAEAEPWVAALPSRGNDLRLSPALQTAASGPPFAFFAKDGIANSMDRLGF